jgi:hypothetical protein
MLKMNELTTDGWEKLLLWGRKNRLYTTVKLHDRLLRLLRKPVSIETLMAPDSWTHGAVLSSSCNQIWPITGPFLAKIQEHRSLTGHRSCMFIKLCSPKWRGWMHISFTAVHRSASFFCSRARIRIQVPVQAISWSENHPKESRVAF